MGIDIYLKWTGQTEAEAEQQYTGFSIAHGHVGYLREAYHGEPYATKVLCREAFESPDSEAHIPAATLQERLPIVLRLAEERERTIYKGSEDNLRDILQSFRAFVALAERLEREGKKPYIYASY